MSYSARSDELKDGFLKMKTKQDFIILLNLAKSFLLGSKAKEIKSRQLNYYIQPDHHKQHYREFRIPKKSGDFRVIHAPSNGLLQIQRCLNLILQSIYQPNPAATGFIPEKSIVDNASVHVGMHYVFNVDLKDFFPSIDQARIWGRLRQEPFGLSGERQIFANMIAALCCHTYETERWNKETNEWEKKMAAVLPQGAATSPFLTNIICERLDKRLSNLAMKFGLKYTRYADDITFSSMYNCYQNNGEFIQKLKAEIQKENFSLNPSKTRLQKRGYRQEVTGLVVNSKVGVGKSYEKKMRLMLYMWETYGLEHLEKILAPALLKNGKKVQIIQFLTGKMEFLRMVKGDTNEAFQKLKNRFDKLQNKLNPEKNRSNHLSKTLRIINETGMEAAMKYYKIPN